MDAPINWTSCGGGFECATVRVPLDYDLPDGAKIEIDLIRLRASDPDERIGSLFMNPGGPGGSGVDLIRGIAPFMPTELKQKFDLVGFDPRGIMRSTPLLCFDSLEEATTCCRRSCSRCRVARRRKQKDADDALAGACASAVVPSATTCRPPTSRATWTAAERVGDDQLTYLGFSYGSMLGQIYANLFPDRVRAVVIDGVLDPIAWSTGRGHESLTVPVTERLRSAVGARKTLGQFFQQCDLAQGDCAFSRIPRTGTRHSLRNCGRSRSSCPRARSRTRT